MGGTAQISATISAATRSRLDHFTEQRGLKRRFVVEQALLFYMEAHRELTDETSVQTRVVLDATSFDAVAELMERPAAPTNRLVELMTGCDRPYTSAATS